VADGLGYTGKRVVVTGAGGGLTPATVQVLVELGAEVHVADRQRPSIAGIASYTECDVGDADAIAATIDRIGRVLNMAFECSGLEDAPLAHFVDCVAPKLLEHADSAVVCAASSAIAPYIATRAAGLAAAGIRLNGVALPGTDLVEPLVLLNSPRAASVTGAVLVAASMLPPPA
jgi:NAD(P)-dependent dehydrogenase (short-subunit alcohol dehydrogenase family)